ncbi:lipopolysaccharide biosynthesis protein [Flavobacterium okayamense]|uniref:Membrane protein involved in the export of O-antigen and teichoic acid n=1 Tax=Flavobacterium okayamense TaxID=2830782 RepID=A0ABM7S8I4_9FLAO|nr:oligosaccharide flippase family protein [Flavobacterium okayamense]BCY27275.1 hypothetical protein KK2020170_01430 [Flavobacterium okayamense]
MKEHKFAALLSYVNLGLTNLTGILVTPYVIRSLGNQEYGLYTLIGAFVGYLSVLDLGLNNAIIRYVAQYRVQKDERAQENFLATSLIIYCAIAVLLAVFGALFYFNIDYFFSKSLSVEELHKAKIMLIILVFNIAFTLPGGAFTGICSGYEKFIFPRILSILKVIIRTITLVFILHYGSDSIGVVVLDTIINMVFILVTIWYSFSKLKIKIKLHNWDFSFVKEIFKYSFWIFLFALVYQFQWRTGQVILGSTTNTTIVAVFGVGVMLGVYFTTFGNIINNLLLPKAVQAVYNNASNEVLTDQMIKVGRISYILLIYVFGAFLLTGQDFIKLWIGELYLPAYWIALSIMAVYIIPIAQGYSHAILDAKKMLRFKSLNFLLFSIIGAILGYFLSKQYGMYGMITGLVSAVFLLQVVMNFYYQSKLKLNMPKFFIKALFKFTLAFIIVMLVSYYINQQFTSNTWFVFLIKNGLFSCIFFFTMYFVIDGEERKLISKGL